MTDNNKLAKNRDFFQDNNAIKKKLKKKKNATIKPYTTTRIKSRDLLSNISYVGISKEDFYTQNFTFDVYALATKMLNPF